MFTLLQILFFGLLIYEIWKLKRRVKSLAAGTPATADGDIGERVRKLESAERRRAQADIEKNRR